MNALTFQLKIANSLKGPLVFKSEKNKDSCKNNYRKRRITVKKGKIENSTVK
jgi:hypothetical protein